MLCNQYGYDVLYVKSNLARWLVRTMDRFHKVKSL